MNSTAKSEFITAWSCMIMAAALMVFPGCTTSKKPEATLQAAPKDAKTTQKTDPRSKQATLMAEARKRMDNLKNWPRLKAGLSFEETDELLGPSPQLKMLVKTFKPGVGKITISLSYVITAADKQRAKAERETIRKSGIFPKGLPPTVNAFNATMVFDESGKLLTWEGKY